MSRVPKNRLLDNANGSSFRFLLPALKQQEPVQTEKTPIRTAVRMRMQQAVLFCEHDSSINLIICIYLEFRSTILE